MPQGGSSNKKVANGLVALSSAAVLAVYSAGYVRTRAAADRFVLHAAERRPASRPRPITVAANTQPAQAQIAAALDVAPLALSSAPNREKTPNVAAASTPSSTPAPSGATAAVPVEVPAPAVAEAPAPAPVVEQKVEVPAAPVTVAPPAPAPPAPAQAKWKDGSYTGWGYCRHGDIQATVVIEGGRITTATITTCLTRYSCSVIENLPPQVAQRQSEAVDSVSGATQSADAFSDAVYDALQKAK